MPAQNLYLTAQENDLAQAIDTGWLLTSGYLVFLMQCGFAMLEAGATRAKNTKNILMKKTLNATLGYLVYWAVGYAFSFGQGSTQNGFIGLDEFFLYDTSRFAFFFFQWTFASASTAIISGSLAERTQFTSYLLMTFFVTAWIYPVACHWCWSSNGWLKNLGHVGFIDFAGGAVVHMMGGGLGLVGAYIVGPREGRFDPNTLSSYFKRRKPVPIPGHSSSLVLLGAFILWFGWFGFNTGSTLGLTDGRANLAAMIAVNTSLASSTSCIAGLIVGRIFLKQYNMDDTINSFLAGAVSITPACAVLDPWAAFLTGIGSALVYMLSSYLILMFHIDDPLNAGPIHYGPSIWGLISLALFATPDNVQQAYGASGAYGLFYGGGAEQLGIQILGILALNIWLLLWGIPMFVVLYRLKLLRVDHDTEVAGLDNTKHGGTAYPDFNVTQV